MRVLLTGASGFIGSRVLRRLLERGHEVAALVEAGDARRRIADLEGRNTRIDGGLDRIDASLPALSAFAPEGCIHLAWYAEPGKFLESPRNLECLCGSIDLLEGLAGAGCRRFVMSGSCAEYDVAAAPWLREDGPTAPETLYAATKLALASVGSHQARLRGASFAWGRVFHLYGPDEDPRRVVPAAMRALAEGGEFGASEGTQVRDYLHVDDVASAFVVLLEKGAGGIFNICSGEPRTMREILERVAQACAAAGARGSIRFGAIPARPWEPPRIVGDNAKLRALGWAPRIALEEGLAALATQGRPPGTAR